MTANFSTLAAKLACADGSELPAQAKIDDRASAEMAVEITFEKGEKKDCLENPINSSSGYATHQVLGLVVLPTYRCGTAPDSHRNSPAKRV